MVLSLPFVLALVGSAVGLLIAIIIFDDIADAIVCPPISEFLLSLISFASADQDFGEIVVYHSFDTSEQDQSTTGNNLYINAGTFGHLTDAYSLDTKFHSSIPSISGVINQAISVDTESSNQEVILGNWLNEGNGGNVLDENIWEFLVDNSTTTKYTINFWVKGDFSSLGAGEGVSIISSTIPITAPEGLDIWVDEFNQVRIQNGDGQVKVDLTSSPIADNTWNMISFIIDKPDNAKVWINATNQEVISTGGYEFFPIQFIDQPFMIGDINSPFHKLQFGGASFTGVLKDFGMDDLCIVKDYEFTQTDVNTLYNGGIGLPCTEVTGTGTSDIEIPALSQFDTDPNGDSIEVVISDFSENVLFGHIITGGTFTNEEVSRVKLLIQDSSNLFNGKLKAVILSNVTGGGTTFSGDEIIEAESDVLDFATQNQGSGWHAVFNFTGAVIDWTGNDIFVGFNATDVGTPFDPDRLAVASYEHELSPNSESAVCVELFNATSVYDNCDNYIAGFNALVYEWNFVGEDINNKVFTNENFGGGNGGGGGGGENDENLIAHQRCEDAKDTAWTVIGILPVALFFGLFALFSSVTKP